MCVVYSYIFAVEYLKKFYITRSLINHFYKSFDRSYEVRGIFLDISKISDKI